jgi:hypothetical protein
MSIRNALLEFAKDEGRQSAIDKAERWRDVLEEMQEVASNDRVDLGEREMVTAILQEVFSALRVLVKNE